MGESPGDGVRRAIRRRVQSLRWRLGLGAVILVGILLFVAYRLDWQAVVVAVTRADPPLLVSGIFAALAGFACWSEAIRHLLPRSDVSVSSRRGFLVYSTGALVRNAVPLGYASSIAVLGYVYRREAATTFDRSLATVTVAELLRATSSTTFTLTGLLLLAVVGPTSPLVAWLAIGAVSVLIVGTIAITAVWYRREAVERVVNWIAAFVSAAADRVTPGEREPISAESVEIGIAGYYHAVSTVSARRWTLAVALAFSVSGWGALVGSMYLCGLAVGYQIPLPVAMVVVSVGGYAAIVPVPGGLGGYELGVAAIITVLGGTDVVTALAVTVLFRVCSYWSVIVVGIVSSMVLSVDFRRFVAAARSSDR